MTSRQWLAVGLLPLASFYVTWLIVHSKIASTYVERWQSFWEDRFIKRHAKGDEQLHDRMWATGEWHSRLAYLPTCAWCTGFWVTGFTIGFTYLAVPIPLWGLLWLATSAFIGLLDGLTHREA